MFSAVGPPGGGFHTITHRLCPDVSTSPYVAMDLNRYGYLKNRGRPNIKRSGCSSSLVLASAGGVIPEGSTIETSKAGDDTQKEKRSADWKTARDYKERGLLHTAKVASFNSGGLLLQFFSFQGFLPYSELGPHHSQKEPQKSIQDIAKNLVGSYISVTVLQAEEEKNLIIFSEKAALWLKHSSKVDVGDVFDGTVAFVEDYGAFVNLRFPDGEYYLSGLVHISEVSWDFVQDARDVLHSGDLVKVKVISIDREKARIALSIKLLEDDPLLEGLDKVIPQEGQPESDLSGMSSEAKLDPLPGLEIICNELRQEEGIDDVKLGRQGLEKRVVSPDLQLWLSSAPAKGNQFKLLARAGRQVQEVHLTTSLDPDQIKQVIRRVLGRVP